MYIRELQTPKQKKPSSKGRAGAGRRTLTLMVFMRLGYTPHVITCTGSHYPGMPKLKQFKYPDSGKLYTSLGNIEYRAGIEKALTHLTSKDAKARSLRSGPPVVLLHDNDTAHTARKVAEFAAKQRAPRVLLRYLPPHSPDLTPHDSGFLAEVKREWHKLKDEGQLSWADLCNKAIELIQKTVPDNYIRAIPLRWRACAEEAGWHIEERLEQLKRG